MANRAETGKWPKNRPSWRSSQDRSTSTRTGLFRGSDDRHRKTRRPNEARRVSVSVIIRATGATKVQNGWMTSRVGAASEVIDYRRSAGLPGVEVIDAQHSPREWRVMCPHYAVVMFRTWRGAVHSRGRIHAGEPGVVFCNTPGEVMVATPQGAGSFSVLELESEVLEQWLAEQQSSAVQPNWAAVMRPISAQLRGRFCDFFEVFEPTASTMEVQSQLLELSELMVSELIRGAREPRPSESFAIHGAARMRECLHEEGLSIDLETLAKRAGLSRFHALRAFKQRYGLPPHAYQLCLRIGHARRLLVDGAPAADVAVRCGFADQSHFTRHFKRLNGVTPMQYARAHTTLARRTSRMQGGVSNPSELIARSDF